MKFKNIFRSLILEKDTSILSVLKKIASQKGILIDASRHQPHLRLKCPSGDYEDTLRKVLDVDFSIKQSESELSKTYPTYDVTLEDEFNGFPRGTLFLYVPASRKILNANAFISDKQLTPENIIDLTKPYSINDLYSSIMLGIESLWTDSDFDVIKGFLKDLCDVAIGKNTKPDATGIDKTDVSRIMKDFGELVSALGVLYDYPEVKYIKFPEKSNERMVDFYGLDANRNIILNFSVKSSSGSKDIGAAPSMKNIVSFLNDNPVLVNPKAEVFRIFTDNTKVVDKIIEACKIVDPEAIKLLEKALGHPATVSEIDDYCRENLPVLKDNLKKFFDFIGRTFDDKSLKKVDSKNLKGYAGYSGFVLSPLGYHVVDILNKDPEYKELINSIIQKMDAIQANVVWKNGLKLSYEGLKQAKFKFDFHNNVFLPGNNNFGFKVMH